MHNIDENKVLRDALSGLNEDIPPMPEGLHAAWMQKVEDDMNTTRTDKTRTMKTVTRWLSIAAALVFVIGGTLLTRDDLYLNADRTANQSTVKTRSTASTMGAALANDSYAYTDEAYDAEYAAEKSGVMLKSTARGTDSGAGFTAAPAPAEKKIIRTASLTIATQTFEESLSALRTACEEQNGWIESSSENVNSYSGLRTAYLTLRLPQSALDGYLAGTEALGRVTYRYESATDVTESYQDTQARLNTQLALMERLQALITESADLSDLLELESQIAETQYQIDRLQTSLNSTDRQVAYSTVDVTLQEEKTVELTDKTVTFGERLLSAIEVGAGAFVGFILDTIVFLVAAAPFILIVVVAAVIIRLMAKRRRK